MRAQELFEELFVLLLYDDTCYLYQMVDFIVVVFKEEFLIFSCWKIIVIIFKMIDFAQFLKFNDFDGPTSKRHISGNRCRNQKLGSIELYGNTV